MNLPTRRGLSLSLPKKKPHPQNLHLPSKNS